MRTIAVVGLLSAALFAALPWLGCNWNSVRGGLDLVTFGRLCTFGFPGPDFAPGRPGIPGFNGPYWGNLITGAVYVAAALYVAMTKRF